MKVTKAKGLNYRHTLLTVELRMHGPAGHLLRRASSDHQPARRHGSLRIALWLPLPLGEGWGEGAVVMRSEPESASEVTVSNMVDEVYGVRGDQVEQVWTVAARGAVR